MGNTIKKLTDIYGTYPDTIGKQYMLKYVNNDFGDVVKDYKGKCIDMSARIFTKEHQHEKHTMEYFIYMVHMDNGDIEAALNQLKQSFKEGSAEAMAQYAYDYCFGEEITNKPNYRKASKLFKKALSKPSMFAEYLYAEMLIRQGNGDIDAAKAAIPYYEKALGKGVLFAMYKLACCYLKTNTQLDRAEKLFEMCLEDNPDAKNKLEQVKKLRVKKSKLM